MTWSWVHSLPWSSIWEAFTAIGTVAMAVTTGVIILQNKREHQDSFRPICVLIPDEGLDVVARRGLLRCHEETTNAARFYLLRCSISNVGEGPALNVRLILRTPTHPGVEIVGELPPLGATQTTKGPLTIPVLLNDNFNRMDYEVAPDESWELCLVYEDVFGQAFHTIHSKNAQLPWVRVEKKAE